MIPTIRAIKSLFYEFFQRYELSRLDYEILFAFAKDLNIPLFSTPFDDVSLNMMVELNAPAIKIASPDLTWLPFLKRLRKQAFQLFFQRAWEMKRKFHRH